MLDENLINQSCDMCTAQKEEFLKYTVELQQKDLCSGMEPIIASATSIILNSCQFYLPPQWLPVYEGGGH